MFPPHGGRGNILPDSLRWEEGLGEGEGEAEPRVEGASGEEGGWEDCPREARKAFS